MIEKIIHYVWLGGNKIPDNQAGFISNWAVLHPNWKIIKWSEDNFDCQSNPWVIEAIRDKNYALAADVIRSYVLLNHGGVYLDTDIELLCPLDKLVQENDFFIGYETDYWFGCAVLGAKKGHPIMKEVFDRYLQPCKGLNKSSNMLCVLNFTAAIKRLYNPKLVGKTTTVTQDGVSAKLCATDWFFPQHYITRKTTLTPNTVAIHHYSSAWLTKGKILGIKVANFIKAVFGKHIFGCFEKIARKRMLTKLAKEYKQRIRCLDDAK